MRVGVRARKNPRLNQPQIREAIKSRPGETQPGALKELAGVDAAKIVLNYFQRVVEEKGSPKNQGSQVESCKGKGGDRGYLAWLVPSSWLSAPAQHCSMVFRST